VPNNEIIFYIFRYVPAKPASRQDGTQNPGAGRRDPFFLRHPKRSGHCAPFCVGAW
jgi:hypothetical protein